MHISEFGRLRQGLCELKVHLGEMGKNYIKSKQRMRRQGRRRRRRKRKRQRRWRKKETRGRRGGRGGRGKLEKF